MERSSSPLQQQLPNRQCHPRQDLLLHDESMIIQNQSAIQKRKRNPSVFGCVNTKNHASTTATTIIKRPSCRSSIKNSTTMTYRNSKSWNTARTLFVLVFIVVAVVSSIDMITSFTVIPSSRIDGRRILQQQQQHRHQLYLQTQVSSRISTKKNNVDAIEEKEEFVDAYGNDNAATRQRKRTGYRPQEQKQQRRQRQESLDHGNDALLSLNLNLDALASCNDNEKSATRAEELYTRISKLYKMGYYDQSPDIVSFNSVLKAWRRNPRRALEFWEHEASTHGRTINVRSYNTFLLSLALSGMDEQAHNLLQQMHHINAAVRPDRISYNTVLLAYAKTSDTDEYAAGKAQELLDKMINDSRTNSSSNSINDNDEITDSSKENDDVISRTSDSNYRTPTPDIMSYNTVLLAWSKHPHTKVGMEQARGLLNAMVLDDDCDVVPDVISYTTVLRAYSRLGGKSIVDDAISLVAQMEDSDDDSIWPNRITYTTLMKLLCRCGRTKEAQQVLVRMRSNGVRPNTPAVSALIDGYSNYITKVSDVEMRKDAVRAVFLLLRQMNQSNYMRPNGQTYTSVLKAVSNSRLVNSGEIVRHVLDEMWNTVSAASTSSHQYCRPIAPDTIHYNTAIYANVKSDCGRKALDAAILLDEMEDNEIPCDIITYNGVLSAAANAFGPVHVQRESLQVGLRAYNAIHESDNSGSVSPTSITYSHYFKMLRRLPNPPNRIELIECGVVDCCRNGCLNTIVLKQIQSLYDHAEYDIFHNMFKLKNVNHQQQNESQQHDDFNKTDQRNDDGVNDNSNRRRTKFNNNIRLVSDLPSEWSRNAFHKMK